MHSSATANDQGPDLEMLAKIKPTRGDNEASSLLTVVRFVVRERLQMGEIDLPHVWRSIDDFLSDLPRGWPLAEAYLRTGSLRCMQYVAARESKEVQHPSYRMWIVNNIAALAIDRGDVKALEWLAQSYSPDTPARVEDW